MPGKPTLAKPVNKKQAASCGIKSARPRYSVSSNRPVLASTLRSVSPNPVSEMLTETQTNSAAANPNSVAVSKPTSTNDEWLRNRNTEESPHFALDQRHAGSIQGCGHEMIEIVCNAASGTTGKNQSHRRIGSDHRCHKEQRIAERSRVRTDRSSNNAAVLHRCGSVRPKPTRPYPSYSECLTGICYQCPSGDQRSDEQSHVQFVDSPRTSTPTQFQTKELRCRW